MVSYVVNIFFKKMCISVFSVRVLATLTADVGRILSKLHQVQPNGNINFSTGIRIAHVIYYLLFYVLLDRNLKYLFCS